MFGLDKLVKGAVNTVEKAVTDPVGTVVDTVTQPIADAIEVFGGLTEGELRIKAAARLGADVVAGMAIEQLVEWATEEL